MRAGMKASTENLTERTQVEHYSQLVRPVKCRFAAISPSAKLFNRVKLPIKK